MFDWLSNRNLFLLSLLSFLGFTALLSGRDYLIHNDLYQWGLQPDMTWVMKDWAIYACTLQLAVFACAFMVRSHRLSLLVFYESFVLSSTQDLIFFGLWGKGLFPTTSWDWMYYAVWFGSWSTQQQFMLSAVALTVGALVAYLIYRKREN